MSGGVNNDVLMYTAGAALLYVLALAFRQGLTPRLGVALGLTMLVGLLAKSSFLGLVPGVLLGCALLAWRDRARRRQTALATGIGAAVAAVPFGLWMVANEHLFDRVATTTAGFTSSTVNQAATLGGQLSYLWGYFLPRLPFTGDYYPGEYPLWDTYFQAFVGRFGWFQYGFPDWVNWGALPVFLALAALAAVAIARARPLRTGRWIELVTYAALLGGLTLLVNVAGYRYKIVNDVAFEQVRYLFPLLGLWGLFVAAAARGAGRRLAPAVAGFLLVLVMAHSLFAMLLTLSRYYA
jgi:hypothetical protein